MKVTMGYVLIYPWSEEARLTGGQRRPAIYNKRRFAEMPWRAAQLQSFGGKGADGDESGDGEEIRMIIPHC